MFIKSLCGRTFQDYKHIEMVRYILTGVYRGDRRGAMFIRASKPFLYETEAILENGGPSVLVTEF